MLMSQDLGSIEYSSQASLLLDEALSPLVKHPATATHVHRSNFLARHLYAKDIILAPLVFRAAMRLER